MTTSAARSKEEEEAMRRGCSNQIRRKDEAGPIAKRGVKPKSK